MAIGATGFAQAEFAQGWLVWIALGLAVVAAGLGWWWGSRGRGDAELQDPVLVSRATRVTRLPGYRLAVRKRRTILSGLAVFALLSLTAAGMLTARPQAMHVIQPETKNRDIMLCLDVSGSMTDVVVETIEVFEQALKGFAGERIGLTIFNASAVQIFPLTDDYQFVTKELARIRESFGYFDDYPEHWAGTLSGPGASLIGDGLASCVIGFDHEGEERSRSVIFATDNELQGDSSVTIEEAAAYAKEQEVRVYAINPVDERGEANSTELRDAMLLTGGNAYGLRDETAVPEIIAQVQRQEARLLLGEQRLVVTDAPNLWIAVFSAAALVWIAAAWRLKL